MCPNMVSIFAFDIFGVFPLWLYTQILILIVILTVSWS